MNFLERVSQFLAPGVAHGKGLCWRVLPLCAVVGSIGCSLAPTAAQVPDGSFVPTTSAANRCSVAADQNDPLVTEWSAAEKAYLESLLSERVVAVEYSGCELRIVPECRLPGSYTWHWTTLATDTVDIEDAEELYAKLPIGAVSLEAELQRSGHLAVQTTVAGQLRVSRVEVSVPKTAECARATHWVNALSVGAFKLFSGGGTRESTSVEGVVEGGSGVLEERVVLREAGAKDACAAANESAADPRCASPIQLFLEPIGRKQHDERMARARRSGAVQLSLAAPEAIQESWTLRDQSGTVLCAAPCRHWVKPASGYYLQREAADADDTVRLDLPQSFPAAPGSELDVAYRAERGAPFTSKVLFLGLGIPLGVTGVMFTAFAIDSFTANECDDDCQFDRTVLLPLGLSYLAATGGLYYWFSWSHEQGLEMSSSKPATSDTGFGVGPGIVSGSF